MDGFTTRAIRAATRAPRVDQRPTSVPIYQTATFSSADAE
jgi:O-acetylhomoserine/O-acetylserine sulfhydrylase-like pyridoxal-dependent enzyme